MVLNGDESSQINKSTRLIVIIDIFPSVLLLGNDENLYEKWLNSIISFCNAHLLFNSSNKLDIIATNFNQNTLIYPDSKDEIVNNSNGQYELFSQVTSIVYTKIKSLVCKAREFLDIRLSSNIQSSSTTSSTVTQSSSSVAASLLANGFNNVHSLMPGAIAIALAKMNKCKDNIDYSRIAIITAGDDNSSAFASQYMNFMNVYFTAQKMNVVIDACIACLPDDHHQHHISRISILQQGCDLTKGLYVRISNITAFFEYLVWILLPDAETRLKLVLPTQRKISYKATCFCHRNLIDIGFVCSVCLSIFCSFSPICSTCHTIFKLAPLPSAMKMKKKLVKSK